jgi:hypothetical protein
VQFKNQPIILASRLGINFADGTSIGRSSRIDSVTTRSHREENVDSIGKRSRELDHCSEAVISLHDGRPAGRR